MIRAIVIALTLLVATSAAADYRGRGHGDGRGYHGRGYGHGGGYHRGNPYDGILGGIIGGIIGGLIPREPPPPPYIVVPAPPPYIVYPPGQ
jgi:hypothetical protein